MGDSKFLNINKWVKYTKNKKKIQNLENILISKFQIGFYLF